MHYRNGREAKNGDKVVHFASNGPRVGLLYDAVPGNDACNGRLAQMKSDDHYVNLSECLHADDVKDAADEKHPKKK